MTHGTKYIRINKVSLFYEGDIVYFIKTCSNVLISVPVINY